MSSLLSQVEHFLHATAAALTTHHTPAATATATNGVCHLISVPKDILLRKIAVLLEDNEIIYTGQCSHSLLKSLHDTRLRRHATLREWIEHRPTACQEFITTALSADEIQVLREKDGWKIKEVVSSSSESSAPASVSASASASPSLSSQPLSIGTISSIRWCLEGKNVPRTFFLPLLHHLPHSIRSLHFGTSESSKQSSDNKDAQLAIDCDKLTLPSHLTELTFHRGACNISREMIEKLMHIEILKVGMSQIVGVGKPVIASSSSATSAAAPPSTTTTTTSSSSPKRDLLINFPASLHTLTTFFSTPVSSENLAWPPALTRLDLLSILYAQDCWKFPRLPDSLTQLKCINGKSRQDLMLYMISMNLLPPRLKSIHLGTAIDRFVSLRPGESEWSTPRTAVVWKGNEICEVTVDESAYLPRNVDCDENVIESPPVSLVLPLVIVTSGITISRLLSLTLPNKFDGYDQLVHLTSLTHLGNVRRAIEHPSSLERLEMSDDWLHSMEHWQAPPRLTLLKLGHSWNMPLTSLKLPSTLLHLHLGWSYDRPPPSQYNWPQGLRSLSLDRATTYRRDYAKSIPRSCRMFVTIHSRYTSDSILTEYDPTDREQNAYE